jgi:upstream activation factor subunit UAF30
MATAKKGSGGKSGGAAKKGGAGGGGRGASKGGGAGKGGASKGAAKGGAAKGAAKGGASKGGAAKGGASKRGGASKGGAAKRTPNPAFMKPMTPSSQLAAVVGANPAPRTEITKKLWDYIKKKGLQDPNEKRMINADENLRPIFKKDRVSMFDMTKLVNKHLSDG